MSGDPQLRDPAFAINEDERRGRGMSGRIEDQVKAEIASRRLHPDDGYSYEECNGPSCRAIRDAAARAAAPSVEAGETRAQYGPDYTASRGPRIRRDGYHYGHCWRRWVEIEPDEVAPCICAEWPPDPVDEQREGERAYERGAEPVPLDVERLRCGNCGDDLLLSEIVGHLLSEGRTIPPRQPRA